MVFRHFIRSVAESSSRFFSHAPAVAARVGAFRAMRPMLNRVQPVITPESPMTWRSGLQALWRKLSTVTVVGAYAGASYWAVDNQAYFEALRHQFSARIRETMERIPLRSGNDAFYVALFEEIGTVVIDDEPQAVLSAEATANREQIADLTRAILEIVEAGGTSLYIVGPDGSIDGEVRPSEYQEGMNVVRNTDRFRERIEELYTLSGGQPSDEIINSIIERCTMLGSYSLLTILNSEEFGLTDKLKDNIVLNHAAGDRVEFYADAFRVAQITHATFRGQVANQEVEDTARVEEDGYSVPLDPYDPEISLMAMMAYSESMQKVDIIRGRYRHVAIIEDGKVEGYDTFIECLKNEAKVTGKTVTGYAVETGSHFTTCQLQVSYEAGAGYQARFFHMDSLGAQAGNSSGFYWQHILPKHFEVKKLKMMTSELKVQRGDSMGCSIFSAFNLYHLIHIPEYLADVLGGEYAELPPEDRLFRYLEEHTTYRDVADRILVSEDKTFDKGEWREIRYDVVVPPMIFSAMKQTFSSDGRVQGFHPILREFDVSAKSYKTINEEHLRDESVFGSVGLDIERSSEWTGRQQEQHLPANVHTDDSFNSVLARYTKTFTVGGKVKKRNEMMPERVREWRQRMAQWMSQLPAKEVLALQDRYTLKSFASNAPSPAFSKLPVGGFFSDGRDKASATPRIEEIDEKKDDSPSPDN